MSFPLSAGLVFDRTVLDAPLTVTRIHTRAAHMRRDTGAMYIVDGTSGKVMRWDGDDVNRAPYEWRSKTFVVPQPMNFGCVQTLRDESGNDAAVAAQAAFDANQVLWAAGAWKAGLNDQAENLYDLNGSAMITVQPIDLTFTTLRVYADGSLTFTADVETEKIYRMPSGFLASHWEVEIMSNKGVRRVTLATSSKEIAEQ